MFFVLFWSEELIIPLIILELFAPCDWMLISRWDRVNSTGLIFFNVYVPAHTRGFAPSEVTLLSKTFEDLVLRFPGDKFVFAGDFNIDRVRFERDRFQSPCLK